MLYSQAFRAAVGNELTSVSVAIKGSKNISPEIIDVYELIYMVRKKDWQFTANGFYSKWTDGIINVPNPDFVPEATPGSPESFASIYTNEGESQSYGIEMEAIKIIVPFQINFGLSYAKSEALHVSDPMNRTEFIDQEYDIFPLFSFKAGLSYNWKGKKLKCHVNNILYLGMKEFPSSYITVDRKPDDLPPFWRVDVNIQKCLAKKLKLSADIRNIFNRKNRMPSVWGMKDGIEEPGISALIGMEYLF